MNENILIALFLLCSGAIGYATYMVAVSACLYVHHIVTKEDE